MKPNPRDPKNDIDGRIIHRYTDQPSALPGELRARIERSWGGSPVQLYAYADLDSSLQLAKTWVALGPTHIAVVELPASLQSAPAPAPAPAPTIHVFERSRITSVHEAPGLSATLLTIVGEPGEAPLAQLRYTNRQRPA